jgi:hypothetical protein
MNCCKHRPCAGLCSSFVFCSSTKLKCRTYIYIWSYTFIVWRYLREIRNIAPSIFCISDASQLWFICTDFLFSTRLLYKLVYHQYPLNFFPSIEFELRTLHMLGKYSTSDQHSRRRLWDFYGQIDSLTYNGTILCFPFSSPCHLNFHTNFMASTCQGLGWILVKHEKTPGSRH